jgi:glycosyltransferase involved in cell wall biosynthesis
MKNKKLNIGFSFNRANAGPSNFMNNLKSSLEIKNISKTSFFINPFTSCNIYANQIRNPWNKPYFFRVDGVGFDTSKTDEETKKLNETLLNGIKNSKGVIYQSEFSKKLAEKTLGYKPKNSTIIINGTNQDIFNNEGDNLRSDLDIPENSLVFVTSAKWRPRKRLEDTIDSFKRFRNEYNKDTYLIVIGYENTDSENIIYIPHIENSELPKYLRTADIYLFLGWVDPCPNSVVEAISCGLPVICTNIGGTKEIVELTNSGIVVNTDPEYDYSFVNLNIPPKVDINLIVKAMLKMSSNINKYKEHLDASKIDINYVSSKYYQFMKKTLKGI